MHPAHPLPPPSSVPSARQLAFLALRAVHQGAFADVAIDRVLQPAPVSDLDRRLMTELVYGSIRRQRTLDALIDQLATKPSRHQPLNLRLILHLGLYQLRYLSQIPAAAAVDTTVELAKQNGLKGLAGFVNGVLRTYGRNPDLLTLPADPIARLAVQHSYPDWIVQVWCDQVGLAATEQLCDWFNQPPHLDLRINPLRTSRAQVEAALRAVPLTPQPMASLPQAIRLPRSGAIQALPGFAEGWWMVQDGSAQLAGHLLDPQPGEVVVDACAAPGGKTTHLAELMQDQGTIWAIDRYAARLRKVEENAARLGLRSIQTQVGDSRQLSEQFPQWVGTVDRVLVDVPCSGLGTLNRHADARWRQTRESALAMTQLQADLLSQAATWVKPGGVLVYATCTLHPPENEAIVQAFLTAHPHWRLDPPAPDHPAYPFVKADGWLTVWPHQWEMDGFFMARLRQAG